jgi:hypothetical protein
MSAKCGLLVLLRGERVDGLPPGPAKMMLSCGRSVKASSVEADFRDGRIMR